MSEVARRLKAGGPGSDPALRARVDAVVTEAFQRSRALWPTVKVGEAHFAEELARRIGREADPLAALEAIHAEDVYLAVGCGAGDGAALGEFERKLIPEMVATLRRVGLSANQCDEALQALRSELLAAAPGARPRILNFGGSGPLRAWLRSIAARIGVRLLRKEQASTPLHESMLAAAQDDLELEFLKRTYAGSFQEAFRSALSSLPATDRLLLKERLRHGLSLEDLAALHGVHAATISRWVTDARERLVLATRDNMMRTLNIGRAEVSSILRLIHSELEVTLSTVP